MRIVKIICWVLIISFAVAACGMLPSEDTSNEMNFSENEVFENEGGMEFTEEEVEDSSENNMEFTEDEVDSDESPDDLNVVPPQEGTWLLTYEPGHVQCGTGPYVEGNAPLEESVTLVGSGDEGFEMQQSGQDRTLSFTAVYSDDFLDPFADNIVNNTSPADMLLVNRFAYQTAFQEGGANFYMILYPLSEDDMIGTFLVQQDDCLLEKQLSATHQ
ncbi:MAG TPA: hypothetical protein VJ972_01640 [Anaerolineales bacterium]|nr:hypothetical protein [Anaerolineales bacterium]